MDNPFNDVVSGVWAVVTAINFVRMVNFSCMFFLNIISSCKVAIGNMMVLDVDQSLKQFHLLPFCILTMWFGSEENEWTILNVNCITVDLCCAVLCLFFFLLSSVGFWLHQFQNYMLFFLAWYRQAMGLCEPTSSKARNGQTEDWDVNHLSFWAPWKAFIVVWCLITVNVSSWYPFKSHCYYFLGVVE